MAPTKEKETVAVPFHRTTKGKAVFGVIAVIAVGCVAGVTIYVATRSRKDNVNSSTGQQGRKQLQQQNLQQGKQQKGPEQEQRQQGVEQEQLSADSAKALEDELVELGKTKSDSSLVGVDEALGKKLAKASPQAVEKFIQKQPQDKQPILRELVKNTQTREKALKTEADLKANPGSLLTSKEAAILEEVTKPNVVLDQTIGQELKSHNSNIPHQKLSHEEEEKKSKARDVAFKTFTSEAGKLFMDGYDAAQLPAKYKAIKDAYLKAASGSNPADAKETLNITVEKDEDVAAYMKAFFNLDTLVKKCAFGSGATPDAAQWSSGTFSFAASYSDLRSKNQESEAKMLLDTAIFYYDFYYMIGVAEAAVEKRKLEDAVTAANDKAKMNECTRYWSCKEGDWNGSLN